MTAFLPEWRRLRSAAFSLPANGMVAVNFWNCVRPVYGNANLSIYSGQSCNARCPFCVEELRPASRGRVLAEQKGVLTADDRYFTALEEVLTTVAPLRPSVSITGGEATLDPRLPDILRRLRRFAVRKPTLTTNGSGLLQQRQGRRVVDWIGWAGIRHLNLSRAHPEDERNGQLMGFTESPSLDEMKVIVEMARAAGVRVRLSCVLLKGEVDSLAGVLGYLDYARMLGVDNVIFRELMTHDPQTVLANPVTSYCDRQRVSMDGILATLNCRGDFEFKRQVVGYYYYVEVWEWGGMDVVFEGADLARLEWTKQNDPATIHELVFHPNGLLTSTWQPWDGILGP